MNEEYTIVQKGGAVNSSENVEIMMKSEASFEHLPTNVAPGSIAATANLSVIYRFSMDRKWEKVGE